jgi:large subunit ribosomal protein L22
MQYGIAKSKYIRISPQKARLAAGLIRGIGVDAARWQLEQSQLKAGRLLKKTLDSAVANAESSHDIRREDLQVVEVRVDVGPTLKRGKARSRGSRSPILKRTSHLTVIVGTKQGVA